MCDGVCVCCRVCSGHAGAFTDPGGAQGNRNIPWADDVTPPDEPPLLMHYMTSCGPRRWPYSDSAGGDEMADWALFSTSLR